VTVLNTCLALVAFAANSLLCRLALGGGAIDAASFTTVRLASGAAMLLAIATFERSNVPRSTRTINGTALHQSRGPGAGWRSALALFLYAIAFSFAYVSLPVATGALILFGAVQTTMLMSALRSGERPRPLEWLGLVIAVAGLAYLVSPGLTAPPLFGSAMMASSGVAWGWYSLWGRHSASPIGETTTNFVRAAPLAIVVSLVSFGEMHATARGAALAAVSGAVTSGLGYVAWYAALRRLTAMRAATVQLATPVLTAAGGVVFLSEELSTRLGISAALILGGIGLATTTRLRISHSTPNASSTLPAAPPNIP
jgi:drug/metabolite transporter (DMT)-like permease